MAWHCGKFASESNTSPGRRCRSICKADPRIRRWRVYDWVWAVRKEWFVSKYWYISAQYHRYHLHRTRWVVHAENCLISVKILGGDSAKSIAIRISLTPCAIFFYLWDGEMGKTLSRKPLSVCGMEEWRFGLYFNGDATFSTLLSQLKFSPITITLLTDIDTRLAMQHQYLSPTGYQTIHLYKGSQGRVTSI